MSAEKPNQNKDLAPRKKKKSKRKANSPLSDTGSSDHANSVNNGVNNGFGNVSNTNSAFIFPNPQSTQAIMNFSQQGTPLFGAGAFPGPPLSQSPNQMTTYGMPPQQTMGPPSWATEIMNDVKQIKLSLAKLDQIEKTVNSINAKVSDLELKVNNMEAKVNTVERSCEFMSSENDDRKAELNRAKSDLTNLKGKCDNLESNAKAYIDKSAKLEAKLTDLESRSMRDNLLFYGVPEQGATENCENIIKAICAEKLELHEAHNMTFDRVHRVGNASGNKPRPIVAKFHYFKQREIVRQASYDKAGALKGANIGIGIQWPQQVREARKTLYPIMQQEKSKGNTVKMVRDKLFVNGAEYVPGQTAARQQQP